MANIISGRRRLGRYRLAAPIVIGGGGLVVTFPLQESGFAVLFYNSSGVKIAEYANNIKSNPLQSIEFDHRETGCGDIKLVFGRMPSTSELTYNSRVDVHLFGDSSPWYSGYIIQVPKAGTTDKTFTYKGHGFYGQMGNILINETYEDTEISAIARSIIRAYVEPNTDIVYSSSKIYSTGYTATMLKYSYVTPKEAVEDLVEYAGNFVAGVDELRRFYFKEMSSTINESCRFRVGKHIQDFKPEESIDDLRNYLYIKASSAYVTSLTAAVTSAATSLPVVSTTAVAAGDIIKIDDEEMYVNSRSSKKLNVTRGYNSTTAAAHSSGTLISNTSISSSTTRILATSSDAASIAAYGKRADILDLPSAMSEDDAQRWGDYKLDNLKSPTVTATANNVDIRKKLIKADGMARVTCTDGTVYELAIVKVTYKYTSAGLVVNMQLGALPADKIAQIICKLVRDQRTRELLGQYESDEE